jgi:1-deoxy-D-xylulose 5-phosphate reductoisomerase
LKGKIGFPRIAAVVEETLRRMPNRQPNTVGEILEIDEESRSLARELVAHQAAAGAQTIPARV